MINRERNELNYLKASQDWLETILHQQNGIPITRQERGLYNEAYRYYNRRLMPVVNRVLDSGRFDPEPLELVIRLLRTTQNSEQ